MFDNCGMDEVKTLEENVTTNGEGSANLAKNGELEPQIQVRKMDTNNNNNNNAPNGTTNVISEENPTGIEQKVSTDPKPLDSPIDDRLTPSPEPFIQQTEEKPNDLLSEREEDGPMGQNHVQEDVMPSVVSEPESNVPMGPAHVQEKDMPSVVPEPSKPEPELESNDPMGPAHVQENVMPSIVSEPSEPEPEPEPESKSYDPIDSAHVKEDVIPSLVSKPEPEQESNDLIGSTHAKEDVMPSVVSEPSNPEPEPESNDHMGPTHVQEDVNPTVPSEPKPETEPNPNDVSSERGEHGPVGQDHVKKDTISSVHPETSEPEPNDPKTEEDGSTARVPVQEDVISSEPKPESNDPKTTKDGPMAQGQVQEGVISSKQEPKPKPNANDVLPNDSLRHVQLRKPVTPKSPLGPANGKITQNQEKASSREGSPKTDKVGSEKQLEKPNIKIGDIDTTAPFESVKAAVSMFAGIVDWKAHKIRIAERRRYVQQELRKAHYEIPVFKKKSEAAEEEKRQVLKELDNTKRLIEELKLNLERTQTEERQANQDAELAKLRVEEMEQGVSDDSSVAAKAQLEVAQARNQAALAELKRVKNELENLQKDYDLLITERDMAIKNAEEAVAESKEIEKTVEGLTIKLITTKDALESVHAAHLEAEEHRIGVSMARDQDASNWEKELQQAQEELDKVNREIISTEELKSKLETASVLLQDLKLELAAYMGEENESAESHKTNNKFNNTHKDIQSAVDLANINLEEVKKEIEKTTEVVNHLKLEANSLNSELEKEKATLIAIRKTEGMASVTVASLEAELKTTISELDLIRQKEKEAREKLAELPKQVRKAAEEADLAKSATKAAHEELQKAKEAAEQAKARENKMVTRLTAAQKEIEAARASERLALGAISALHESESARCSKNEPETGVTLSLEEYYELSRKVQEAEDQANLRVTEAISQIDLAKESEMKAITKLGQINTDLASKKEELSIAMQKAQKAKEGKLGVEQELRTWRADHEQKRNGGQRGVVHGSNPKGSSDVQPPSHLGQNHKPDAKAETTNNNGTGSSRETKPRKKKRRSFFPRFFMFFSRKKHSSKST